MDMIVDVLAAKAVVTVTAGTVAEFKIGIVGVCFAAYRAFVPIWFVSLLFFCLFCRFLEVYGLRIYTLPPWPYI